MKRQDIVKYQEQSVPELNQAITGLQKQLVEVKMQASLGKLKNVHQGKNLRGDIARLKSIVRQKQLTNQTGSSTVKVAKEE